MKIKFNKFSIILLIILMVTAISIGCQPEEEEPEDNDNVDSYDDPETDDDMNEGVDEGMEDNDMTDDTEEDMDGAMNDNSEMIADSIVEMEGINDATVVVRDNTAFVGIDAADTTDGEVSDQMRQDIETKVKEEDENITEVYISAEEDLFDRINEIAQNVRQGDPIEDFGDDLEDLIDRLTPNGAE
ncbi:YhcN/YlaJ family sporulation lipoprotein [Clostridium sp. D2Q-11]|uniref:YhcN/YlaJ family sporulation lipoprotein n=1 Tax=Anaeromonas frigoriresistens TaxID=2683708 RepID=A0A942UYS5_9FIRM|nr:YhcN/YlaJ family sporulation lipoprotein [Anaeromonas frigoriresistens]MBS4540100.1 YhcN/YlaJ family sporulation lipoprotein [Anaeromonas frigoriresistens]